jgi:hypothetical protein
MAAQPLVEFAAMGAVLERLVPVSGSFFKAAEAVPPPLSAVAAELARRVPSGITRRLPTYLPVWRHRVVDRAWHRAVLAARFEGAFRAAGVKLAITELLNMSHGCFEGNVDFVARRVELSAPSRPSPMVLQDEAHLEESRQGIVRGPSLCTDAGAADMIAAGLARVVIFREWLGNDDPEEVAVAERSYTCEVSSGERALVRVKAFRISGLGVGAREDADFPAGRVLAHAALS